MFNAFRIWCSIKYLQFVYFEFLYNFRDFHKLVNKGEFNYLKYFSDLFNFFGIMLN